jgi:hypothetical protein
MLVTREDHRFPEAGAYRPDEALSVEDVITMMTINGARQQRVDDVGGSIEEGKSADLAVLDRDIFSCPPRDLAGTRVLATLFAGMPVHQTHDSPLLNEADVLATPAMWR